MKRSRLTTAVPLLAIVAGICLVDCGGDDNNTTGQGGSAGTGGASSGGAPGSGGTSGAHADGAAEASSDASKDVSVDAPPRAEDGPAEATFDASVVDVAPDRVATDAGADVSVADVVVDAGADGAAPDVTPDSGGAEALADDARPNLPDAAPDVTPDTAPLVDAAPVVDAAPETSAPPPETGPDAAADVASEAAAEAATGEAGDGGVTFSQIVAFFSAPVEHCTDCHTPGVARIDLSLPDTALYTLLTSPLPNNREGTCGGGGPDGGNRTPIVPGSLETSYLWLKITGTQPAGCGSRMPADCSTNVGDPIPCLGDADTQIIRDWILEGAPGP